MPYLLTRTDNIKVNERQLCLVAAISEQEARELANNQHWSEGPIWTDISKVKCKLLINSNSKIILNLFVTDNKIIYNGVLLPYSPIKE